ncbi:MAG TPA: hypothetical protein VKE88_01175 [Candidatus Nanoarchaeia archaeon]|nr:hypothetical protein [Candidatus Nanoarchaeia archaeon]
MKNTVVSIIAALFLLVSFAYAAGENGANVDINQTTLKFSNEDLYLSLNEQISATGKISLTNKVNSSVTVKFLNTELVNENDNSHKVNLTTSPSNPFAMNALEANKQVELRASSITDIESGKYIGTVQIVNASNNLQIFDEIPVEFYITALKINDITVKDAETGNSISKIEKGQKFIVDVELENDAEETDLEDMTVTVGVYEDDDFTNLIENLDGDELEDEEDSDDVSKGKTDTVSFEFEMPFDIENEDNFFILIEATGKSEETGYAFYARESEDIEAKVPDNLIDITKASASPTLLACGANRVKFNIELTNLGSDKEDVELFVRNAATAKEYQLYNGEEVELEDDFSDEDEFTEIVDEYVTLTDVKSGSNTYTVVAYFDDGDKTVSRDVTVTQESCGATTTVPTTTPTQNTNNVPEVVVQPTTPTSTSTPNVPSTSYTPYVTLKDVSGFGFDSSIVVPAVIGVGGLIVGVLVALLLVPKP